MPTDQPPRLTNEAKQAIRDLAALANQSDATSSRVRSKLAAAQAAAPHAPEPELLMGLIDLQARRWTDAERQFESVRTDLQDPGARDPGYRMGSVRASPIHRSARARCLN